MSSVSETIQIIAEQTRPLPTEEVPLASARQRILAEPVSAPEDLPPFDRSAMDGYAILRTDASEWFEVVAEIRAGEMRRQQVLPGQAVRLYTGAALPCDQLQVVMQEEVEIAGTRIRLGRRSGDLHIRFRGEDVRQGTPLLAPGTRLGAGALALLASLGWVHPRVSRLPSMAHFVTGDEIVSPEARPQPGQIRDSNSTLLRALLQDWGLAPHQGRLPEDLDAAWDSLQASPATTADLLLISGGASLGRRDHTRTLLERLGYTIHVSKVNARPGRPLLFGSQSGRVAFGLPGNPVAHWVCFHLFVATALRQALGLPPQPEIGSGLLAATLPDCLNERETFWVARAFCRNGQVWLQPLRWQSSGDVTALASANALLRIHPETPALAQATPIEYVVAGPIHPTAE